MSYSALVQQASASAGLPFTSRRSPIYGTKGMVASSQPLATAAGLRILQEGGNAADAAVAVAAALAVTEPCSTGIGGDAFALYFEASRRKVRCLQGNGASPAALTLERVRATLGNVGQELPPLHALSVAVPGAVALWEHALRDWGKLELAQVLKPALSLAEDGFPVSPITAFHWNKLSFSIKESGNSEQAMSNLLQPDGTAPDAGSLWRNPDLAGVLRGIMEHGAKGGFYTGPVAEAIAEAVKSRDGVMELEDLAAHSTLRVEPLSTTFRDATVWEVPPPTAGIVALMALNLLEADPEPHGSSSVQGPTADGTKSLAWLHSAIESCRMAFADALGCVTDPRVSGVPIEELLDKGRATRQRQRFFDPNKACCPVPDPSLAGRHQPRTPAGDTVQFCVVDGEGNGCSFIQSTYMGFGTGIMPEGCGFTLQNRCHNFSLDPSSPNVLGPRKRPYHTIMPGLVTDKQGELLMTFGCMGGFMQPQGHLQLLSGMLDYGLDPQAALDAPRFFIDGVDSCIGPASVRESHVLLEEGFTQEAAEQLRAKGHRVGWPVKDQARSIFGKGQIIVRDKETGVLCAGSDPRGDGAAFGW